MNTLPLLTKEEWRKKWFDILRTGVSVKNKLAETLNPFEKKFLTEEINYLK